ncbi:TIGR03808 family TAT-translocated repetitive protein [Bradyrhizobium sp. U87765 SZCCT0131]|uniref:TIGR03808 family TAT-translocated repetitive protein n=1 Tax=unclassified Bradyrhizobium TaxID=2631580 RepID=UPI001BAC5B6D|nr:MULTISPECIES: TIGR03808 family TAT-translocated repetitive protein [unclassified Bradyrhizobium]MBR1222659.1 TIGR03808 family TAT-translocated repetitive protein [Bradyrhizobium sp. U87765 SZCCT0131]MBR1265260.1 TIGR03808 family TAT-translocated repetitive protein [Bradyrhizobium sp. U87765 SZCCT0134]MBR1302961.1 TIGR03808 family TAT-translocated repetitive protein [Bradyrhizobium sp. U87765 SZCCT0110]MBR1323659.1 TIGR03808 family TAT-translocated repetitive protein [Bradyrhizobium sp. U8776
MDIDRRRLLRTSTAALASVTLAPSLAMAAASLPSALGRDASQYGVRPNGADDQTRALQRAIDDCARAQVPLALPPGTYRTGLLRLPHGAQIIGVAGASRLQLTNGPSLFESQGGNGIRLTRLVLDGAGLPLATRRGLVHCLQGEDLRIADCEIMASGGAGIWFENVGGEVRGNRIHDIATTAVISFDARGLAVGQNTIRACNVNGVEILRSAPGDDGTLVTDNRIEGIKAGPGGSGQYGNAINAFRAGNVIVRGNRISDCDYSAVRGNSAANIQIVGNSVSSVREVALYSEFSFEGAVIASNTVDGAAVGVSVCNFNEGGRLATVQGNVIRNLLPKRPAGTAPDDDAGIGIYVEADTAVSGNVIENAPAFGIIAGWGNYLRDVAITGNVVRNALVGIGVSVVPGAGTAVVSGNMISGAAGGAIVGLDHAKPVSGDLTREGASRFQQIALGTNTVR